MLLSEVTIIVDQRSSGSMDQMILLLSVGSRDVEFLNAYVKSGCFNSV